MEGQTVKQLSIKSSSLICSLPPVDLDAVRKVNGDFGFRAASGPEIKDAVALAERLIGQRIADLDVLKRLQAHTTVSLWVLGDPVVGMHIMAPLTPAGERAVRRGEFRPENPDLNHCAAPGEPCGGVYVGIYAGETRDARRAIMQGAGVMRLMCFGTVPCFARAATDDGARSMTSLGFHPIEGGLPGLWVQEALVKPSADAA